MAQIIRQPIGHPFPFSTPKGEVILSHPRAQDIPVIVSCLNEEDLDLRRLISTASERLPSIGKARVVEEWDKAIIDFRQRFPGEKTVLEQIVTQSTGIRSYKEIPIADTVITDPFNMADVESKISIEKLVLQQLGNIIVAKTSGTVISLGRLLEVEGSIELVSLWTHRDWRRNGIASKIIHELLLRTAIRPIFSFQRLDLVPFYLRQYGIADAVSVCPFKELPSALQRDLFFMNIFWGPYVIIKIE